MNLAKRLLALVLASVMLLSASPLAYAEGTVSEEAPQTILEELPEELLPADEQSEEADEIPEEASEEAAEEVSENTPDALPFGLPGMTSPLSKQQLRLKQEIARRDVAGAVSALEAGRDFADGQVVALADSLEEAQEIARSYNAELVSYRLGVAVLELTGLSVPQALSLAADETLPLAPIAPNLRYSYGPVTGALASADASVQSIAAPQAKDWYTWVHEVMTDPDPALLDPTSYFYPWFHDTLNTYAAWGVTTGSSEVKVAVLDTGVSSFTGEFEGRLTQVDVGCGLEPIGDEDNAHGTFVSSCIAASMDNGTGTAGVAPDVSILGYRVSSADGGLYTENILRALISCVEQTHPWIINMSFGGPVREPLTEMILQEAYDAGITLLASAGNYGNNSILYPAGYDCTISVAASNPAGTRSAFSTYGTTIDVAAPGTDIPGLLQDGSLEVWDGTSFACPITAGTAALYMSRMGHVSPAEMKQVLLDILTPSSDKTIPGVIDASKLFSGVKTAPSILVFDEKSQPLEGTSVTVTVDGYFRLEAADSNDAMLIYTLDGKNPAARNGEVVSGEECPIEGIGFQDLGLTPGTYTLKAAAISGMGVVSKISSVKLNLLASRRPEEIQLQAPATILAGKSVTLTAQVLPANADQSVIWELVDADPVITLTTKGKLTVPANACGDFTVHVSSAVNPEIWAEQPVSIVSGAPAASVTMTKSKTLRLYTAPKSDSFELNPIFQDAKGNALDISCSFTSSNPKVASVDPSGVVTPVSIGTATITCRALDGSNKSATCKITVLAGLEDVTLSGQTTIAPGSSAKLTVTTVPAKVKNLTVGYSVLSFTPGVTVSKGTVKVDKSVPVGTVITILAMVSEGEGYDPIPATMKLTVAPKAKSMQVSFDWLAYEMTTPEDKPSDYLMPVEYKQSKGNLTSMTLYSTDGLGYGFYAKLNVQCSGTTYSEYTWSSSNPAVASVDRSGVVLAHANGTAKITCALTDGSKLKKTITVKVVTPASSVRVVAKENLVDDSVNLLYFGKSANNTAVLGDAFGKPSSTKVTWDYMVIETAEGIRQDHTEYFHRNKLATISSSGKITLSKKARDFWFYGIDPASSLYIITYAVPKYGPRMDDEFSILSMGAQYICSVAPTAIELLDVVEVGDEFYLLPTNVKSVTLQPEYYPEDDIIYDEAVFALDCNGYYGIYNCTTSNPEVASAFIEYNNSLNKYVLVIINSKKPGTCKVTVYTNDSAKISKTLTVTVR